MLSNFLAGHRQQCDEHFADDLAVEQDVGEDNRDQGLGLQQPAATQPVVNGQF